MEKIAIVIMVIACILTFPVFNSSAVKDMSPAFNHLPASEEKEFYYKEFEASAYNLVESQTDSSPCIGASLTNLCETKFNTFASNALPLGTIIEYAGKHWINQDRMNKRYQGNYLDLCFKHDLKGAKNFGRKIILIKIYK